MDTTQPPVSTAENISINKSQFKNLKKKILFIFLVFFILGIIIIFFIQIFNNKNPSKISQNLQKNEISSTPIQGRVAPDKNAISLEKTSTENDNQKQIWNFIKTNYSNINECEKCSHQTIFFKNKNITIKIDALPPISIKDISDNNKRLSYINEIKKEILALGFKEESLQNFKGDLECSGDIDRGESRDYYYNNDQIFSISTTGSDCKGYEGESWIFGGCYVSVRYFNNIDEQINSQINTFKILGKGKSELSKFSLKNNFYILPLYKIDDYIMFHLGTNQETFGMLVAKINSDGFYDILGNFNELLENYEAESYKYMEYIIGKEFENIPDSVYCTYNVFYPITIGDTGDYFYNKCNYVIDSEN